MTRETSEVGGKPRDKHFPNLSPASSEKYETEIKSNRKVESADLLDAHGESPLKGT